MNKCVYITAALVGLCASLACEDVDFQEGTTLPQSPVLQNSAARSRISLGGLQRVYELRWADGVPLTYERQGVESEFDQLAIGPLEDTIEVTRWSIEDDADRVVLSAEVDNFETVVPVRIEQGLSTRICRVRFLADRMEGSVPVDTRSQIEMDPSQPEALAASGAPSVTFTDRRTELIGSCPPLDASVALDGELDADILDYVEDATTELASRMAEIAPSEELGLLDTDVELTHLTAFDNRRGSLTIFSEPDSTSSTLDETGYALDLDMAVDSSRATCAPPVRVNLPPSDATAPIPRSVLENAGADVGYAVSTRMLSALAQNGVRAGLACIGLEDAPLSDTSDGAVPTDDLDLEVIGLGSVPVGSFAVPVISPGQIPTITSDRAGGVVELTWPDLTIDVYSNVRGVPVRILQLTVTFDFTLQPSGTQGTALALQIGSIEMNSADVESQWLDEDAQPANVEAWARRLLLLLFEDRLQLPLPVEPGAPLELLSTQVRSSDLLLLLRIDSRL
jgi:hypothetical protein